MGSWLSRTHQSWKMYVFIVFGIIVGIIFICFIIKINNPSSFAEDEVEISLFYVCTSLLWFLWIIFAIKCPVCGKKIVWDILRKSPANRWLIILINLSACPNCGDTGDKKDEERIDNN